MFSAQAVLNGMGLVGVMYAGAGGWIMVPRSRYRLRTYTRTHAPGIPRVHFEVKDFVTGKCISNNHVSYAN